MYLSRSIKHDIEGDIGYSSLRTSLPESSLYVGSMLGTNCFSCLRVADASLVAIDPEHFISAIYIVEDRLTIYILKFFGWLVPVLGGACTRID